MWQYKGSHDTSCALVQQRHDKLNSNSYFNKFNGGEWRLHILLWTVSDTFTICVTKPLAHTCLCLCVLGWSSEGVNRTWRQLGRTHWADLNNTGIWREAQSSQPFFIPAVTPLPFTPHAPWCGAKCCRERDTGMERQKEMGNALAWLARAFAHLLCTCSFSVNVSDIDKCFFGNRAGRTKAGRKISTPLCFGARQIKR